MGRNAVALAVVALIGVAGVRMEAQAPAARPTFAVASVRVNNSGDMRTIAMPPVGGRYSATNITLDLLIATAFQPLQRFEITGVPEWARQARFDIDARAEGNVPAPQIWLMLQSLLADRFGLVSRREVQQQPIFAFVVERSGVLGPQLRRHVDNTGCVERGRGAGPAPATAPDGPLPTPPCGAFSGAPARGQLRAAGVSLDMLGRALSGQLGRMVVDRSGLEGTYDLMLEWDPLPLIPGVDPGVTPNASTGSGRPSIFTAVREQLGLRLDSQMGPVSVLVIDRVQMPSEN